MSHRPGGAGALRRPPPSLGAKTLFATHYHELTVHGGARSPGVKNYQHCRAQNAEGRGDHLPAQDSSAAAPTSSYGIEVARLAGLPDGVVSRAKTILKELEEQAGKPAARPAASCEEEQQVSLQAVAEQEVLARLRREQVDTMSPLEALNLLYELKQKLL